MGEVAVENDAGSLFHFQGNHVIHGKGCSVKNLHFRSSAILSSEPGAQARLMSAGFGPEASVFYCSVLEGEPQTDAGGGFGIEEGSILVYVDHSADAGVFEDEHALDEHLVLHFEVCGQLLQLRGSGEVVETRIEIMHGMADLVEGMKEIGLQFTGFIESVFFEEEGDFVAGIEEIIIPGLCLVACFKYGGLSLQAEFLRQGAGSFNECIAFFGGIETFQYQEAVAVELFEEFGHL